MSMFSIVLPCYNHGEYVAEAIQSVLNQTFSDFELFVFDNGSTDNSWEVIDSFTDPRVKKYRIEKNNILDVKRIFINDAKSEWVGVMHSDDVWLNTKLEKQVKLLEANTEAKVCFTWSEYVDADLNTMNTFLNPKNGSERDWWDGFFTGYNRVSLPSFICKKDIYEKYLGRLYPYRQIADYYCWMKLLEETNIYIVEEVLVKQRMHNSGNSAQNESFHSDVNMARAAIEFQLIMYRVINDMDDKYFVETLGSGEYKKDYTHMDALCEKFLFFKDPKYDIFTDVYYATRFYDEYFSYEEDGIYFYEYLWEKYNYSRRDHFDFVGRKCIKKDVEGSRLGRWAQLENTDMATVQFPKKISIYGCGQIGKIFNKKANPYCEVEQFIDRKVYKDSHDGVPVRTLTEAEVNENSIIVVIPTYDFEEISEAIRIEHPNVKEGNIIKIEDLLYTGALFDPEF